MARVVPTPPERFLDTATRTFGDNAELQIIARREIEAMLDPAEIESAGKAAKRLDEVDRQNHRRLTSYMAGAVVVISLLLATWTAWGIYQDRDKLLWFGGSWDDKVAIEWIHTLPPEDQSILIGDPDAPSLVEGTKKLWESNPDNVVYFAEYARESIKASKALPPDFARIAARLDPDNGYFLTLRAGDRATHRCVKQKLPAKTAKPVKRNPSDVMEWEINDPAKWQASLDLLHRAASMPKYESYSHEITMRRLKTLPPPTDMMSYAPRFQYVFVMAGSIPDYSLWTMVAAKAEDCLKQGDREGLLQLRRDWDRLVTAGISDTHPTLIDMLMYRSIAKGPLGNFIAAAEGLGLAEEATMLRARKDRLAQENSPLRQAMTDEAMKLHFVHHAGFLKSESKSRRLPADEEFKPGRLAEYEWFGRIGALAAWLMVALVSLLVWSYRFRAGGPVRRIARRVSDLVTGKDRVWIVTLGVGLPLLFAYIGTYLTPLGARDWSISLHGGVVPTGQLLALLLLLFVLPVAIARFVLAKRAGWLGLKSGAGIAGWIAVAACVSAWVLFGVAQRLAGPEGLLEISNNSGFATGNFLEFDPERAHGPGAVWLWTAEALLAAGLLYLLVGLTRSAFSNHRHIIRRSILARLTLPAYITGLAFFAIAMPLHHAAERHWVSRDTLLSLTPANNGLPALEAELALLDRAQLLEALATP